MPARLEAIGTRIERGLAAVGRDRRRVLDLRRTGGIVALELAVPGGDSGYLSTRAMGLREKALARGVLLRPLGNVLYAMPPACTSDAECDRIALVMTELAQ